LLAPASSTLFGLCWDGCYFVYASLPFGWKASAYIYHSTGLVATSYIRTLKVPCSQYIDDRHNGQLVTPIICNWSDFQKAEAAAYIVTSVLTTLGYTLALTKSHLLPSQCVRFLGYLANSLLKAFLLPEDKMEKFKLLREPFYLEKKLTSLHYNVLRRKLRHSPSPFRQHDCIRERFLLTGQLGHLQRNLTKPSES
jgi:hypothetical protein